MQHTQHGAPPLIVFSHLRWDFVYQRPQHLLSRLAGERQVIFIEEPMNGTATPYFERFTPCAGVEVLRPHTPSTAPGFHDEQLPYMRPLLADYLNDYGIDEYDVWLYTPMALPFASELEPRLVIYDCMDALAHFKGAPRQMQQRENALLKQADLVVCGGPSLYDAKRALHPNVLCLPSAVDAHHYRPRDALELAAEVGRAEGALNGINDGIPHPRLGFFGVIDERLDRDLIAALADADPTWQIVMVGPVVKISVDELPARPNIHWFGQQTYARLPHWVAGWDVCLVPFARNESTRFISPTKTLEYMAAEKPVVSTAIVDVDRLYRHAVAIAHDTDSFIAACRQALAETAEQRSRRIERMRATVAAMSWDATAARIAEAIRAAAAARRRRHVAPVEADARAAAAALAGTAAPAPLAPLRPVREATDGVAGTENQAAAAGL
jgi:glycosyltransferase involved in cell wall biosynthesis